MYERYTSPMSKAPHGPRREVGVRELRDHLSAWLDEVRDGAELIVTERGRPVARIIATTGEAWLDELVAAGVVTLPDQEFDPSSFRRVRANGDLLEFVLEQRR